MHLHQNQVGELSGKDVEMSRDQARLHVPLINRTPEDKPPTVIVAVMGPPGVRVFSSMLR